MDNFKENKLESIFMTLVTEQCWNGTSALLSNQNFKMSIPVYFVQQFSFWEDTTLNYKGHWRPLKRVYIVCNVAG